MRNIIISILLLIFASRSHAQIEMVNISGLVTDSLNKPIRGVKIANNNFNSIHQTDSNGRYSFKIQNIDKTVLYFHLDGAYLPYSWKRNQKFEDSIIVIVIKLAVDKRYLTEVIIYDDKEKRETGKVTIDPKNAMNLPSATGGIEALIKTIVGSNSELSSGYNVRGGNFDENLIYINDYEVFRPYLVSQGQQEGLSFINPELVKNISFYSGGFGAKYGD
ncbi:MAG: hypothetical protein RL582_1052, partial [Bacteroidota bacterium]